MQMTEMQYLPLAPGFFVILVGFFFIALLVLILRSVRYAYESVGISSHAAIFLLLATLIDSFFNIPIAQLPPEHVTSDQVVDFFGVRYAVPVVSDCMLCAFRVNGEWGENSWTELGCLFGSCSPHDRANDLWPSPHICQSSVHSFVSNKADMVIHSGDVLAGGPDNGHIGCSI